MKYSHDFTMLSFWTTTFQAPIYILWDSKLLTYLGPLYFICMTGSIIVVRNARKKRTG